MAPEFFKFYFLNSIMNSRSYASEQYAFEMFGLGEPVISETELIHSLKNLKVPEGIWKIDDKYISIEVKRIIGGNLPVHVDGKRRVIRRRTHGCEKIIWPWETTVISSLQKISIELVQIYKVREHHVVFIVPNEMTLRTFKRTSYNIERCAIEYIQTNVPPCRIFLHIIRGSTSLFEAL